MLWRNPAPIVLIAAAAAVAGCDLGAPIEDDVAQLPDRVTLQDDKSAATVLLEWQAQGAIPRADVNGDGVVNIVDLVIVGQNFGLIVEVTDPPITVVSLLMKDTGFGLYSYQLQVRNEAPVPMRFVYYFRWYDHEGFFINDWIILETLAAGEEKLFRDVLVKPDGALFDQYGIPVFVEGSDNYGLEFESAREIDEDQLD